jgi:hypothetical protein
MNSFKEYVKEVEDSENKQSNDNNILDKIVDFFTTNPEPKDDEVHKLADDLGIEHSELEAKIYGFVGAIFGGGKSHGKEVDQAAAEEGAKVEKEHIVDNEYGQRIALKIGKDHIAELGTEYYPALDKMEKELSNSEDKGNE